ncbi:MAG: SAM-dependent methyltransferase, partial [Alphaproteobacteria bacterium]|nr:SAM-dependent methyltransferase [Alphaproteobacteria bacterium]
CEMQFRNGRQMVFQIQLGHHKNAVPLTRDYLYKTAEIKQAPPHIAAVRRYA